MEVGISEFTTFFAPMIYWGFIWEGEGVIDATLCHFMQLFQVPAAPSQKIESRGHDIPSFSMISNSSFSSASWKSGDDDDEGGHEPELVW